MTLEELLSKYEWYDNSKINIIRSCKRKAFYQLIGPKGVPLANRVGDGANFGTAFHAGSNRYYSLWGESYNVRVDAAVRAFTLEWRKFFPSADMDNKHRLDNGIDILTNYIETHLPEDKFYRPIRGELGFIIVFDPLSFDPFIYMGRIDGLNERLYDKKVFVRELKTVSKSAKDRLAGLKFSHQPRGYVQCLREGLPNLKIAGAMPDVVLVASQTRTALRTTYSFSEADCLSWKEQLFQTVFEWQQLKAGQSSPHITNGGNLSRFTQDTERCFDFGKCCFYDICDYGVNGVDLSDFEPNTWNPITGGNPIQIEVFNAS